MYNTNLEDSVLIDKHILNIFYVIYVRFILKTTQINYKIV